MTRIARSSLAIKSLARQQNNVPSTNGNINKAKVLMRMIEELKKEKAEYEKTNKYLMQNTQLISIQNQKLKDAIIHRELYHQQILDQYARSSKTLEKEYESNQKMSKIYRSYRNKTSKPQRTSIDYAKKLANEIKKIDHEISEIEKSATSLINKFSESEKKVYDYKLLLSLDSRLTSINKMFTKQAKNCFSKSETNPELFKQSRLNKLQQKVDKGDETKKTLFLSDKEELKKISTTKKALNSYSNDLDNFLSIYNQILHINKKRIQMNQEEYEENPKSSTKHSSKSRKNQTIIFNENFVSEYPKNVNFNDEIDELSRIVGEEDFDYLNDTENEEKYRKIQSFLVNGESQIYDSEESTDSENESNQEEEEEQEQDNHLEEENDTKELHDLEEKIGKLLANKELKPLLNNHSEKVDVSSSSNQKPRKGNKNGKSRKKHIKRQLKAKQPKIIRQDVSVQYNNSMIMKSKYETKQNNNKIGNKVITEFMLEELDEKQDNKNNQDEYTEMDEGIQVSGHLSQSLFLRSAKNLNAKQIKLAVGNELIAEFLIEELEDESVEESEKVNFSDFETDSYNLEESATSSTFEIKNEQIAEPEIKQFKHTIGSEFSARFLLEELEEESDKANSEDDLFDSIIVEQAKKTETEQINRAKIEQAKRIETEQANRAKIEQAQKAETEQINRAKIEQTKKTETEQINKAKIEQTKRIETEQANRAKIEQTKKAETEQVNKAKAEQTNKPQTEFKKKETVQANKAKIEQTKKVDQEKNKPLLVHLPKEQPRPVTKSNPRKIEGESTLKNEFKALNNKAKNINQHLNPRQPKERPQPIINNKLEENESECQLNYKTKPCKTSLSQLINILKNIQNADSDNYESIIEDNTTSDFVLSETIDESEKAEINILSNKSNINIRTKSEQQEEVETQKESLFLLDLESEKPNSPKSSIRPSKFEPTITTKPIKQASHEQLNKQALKNQSVAKYENTIEESATSEYLTSEIGDESDKPIKTEKFLLANIPVLLFSTSSEQPEKTEAPKDTLSLLDLEKESESPSTPNSPKSPSTPNPLDSPKSPNSSKPSSFPNSHFQTDKLEQVNVPKQSAKQSEQQKPKPKPPQQAMNNVSPRIEQKQIKSDTKSTVASKPANKPIQLHNVRQTTITKPNKIEQEEQEEQEIPPNKTSLSHLIHTLKKLQKFGPEVYESSIEESNASENNMSENLTSEIEDESDKPIKTEKFLLANIPVLLFSTSSEQSEKTEAPKDTLSLLDLEKESESPSTPNSPNSPKSPNSSNPLNSPKPFNSSNSTKTQNSSKLPISSKSSKLPISSKSSNTPISSKSSNTPISSKSSNTPISSKSSNTPISPKSNTQPFKIENTATVKPKQPEPAKPLEQPETCKPTNKASSSLLVHSPKGRPNSSARQSKNTTENNNTTYCFVNKIKEESDKAMKAVKSLLANPPKSIKKTKPEASLSLLDLEETESPRRSTNARSIDKNMTTKTNQIMKPTSNQTTKEAKQQDQLKTSQHVTFNPTPSNLGRPHKERPQSETQIYKCTLNDEPVSIPKSPKNETKQINDKVTTNKKPQVHLPKEKKVFKSTYDRSVFYTPFEDTISQSDDENVNDNNKVQITVTLKDIGLEGLDSFSSVKTTKERPASVSSNVKSKTNKNQKQASLLDSTQKAQKSHAIKPKTSQKHNPKYNSNNKSNTGNHNSKKVLY